MKNTIFLAIAAMFFSIAAKAQSTVDSIEAKYKLLPMPEAMTTENIFPVIGTYQISGVEAQPVTITLDTANKGIVWINGLPQGRMKAYLRQSPSTYRIVPQTTDAGKQIPEGTMVFSPANNVLNISIGAPYNETDPTAVFAQNTAGTDENGAAGNEYKVTVKTKSAVAKTKMKTHPIFYTGNKTLAQTTTSANPVQQ